MAYGNVPYAGYGDTSGASSASYSISLVAPSDTAKLNEVLPTFTANPDSSDGSSMTIEWEWDTDPGFSNPLNLNQLKTTSGNADEVNANTTPDSNLSHRTYYWRARAGNGSGAWSSYSAVRSFTVYIRQLSASMYMEENVGFEQPQIDEYGNTSKFMEENVGFEQPQIDEYGNTSKFMEENVGFAAPLIDDTGNSSKYMEVDSQDRPAGSETELPPTIN